MSDTRRIPPRLDAPSPPPPADRIEALTETTVTTELDVTTSGLTLEQTIRDYAVEHAIHVLGVGPPPSPRQVVAYAVPLAAYIDTGERP